MTLQKTQPTKLNVFKIADLLLIQEGSIESVAHPIVRRAWHIAFFSWAGFIGLFLSFPLILGDAKKSPDITVAVRIMFVTTGLWLLFITIYLAYVHYRYLIVTKKDLKFQNIAFSSAWGF